MRVFSSLMAVSLSAVLAGVVPAWADSFSLRNLPESHVDGAAPSQQRPASAFGEWQTQYQQMERGETSLKRAISYSLLLPGLGEYYMGRTLRSRVFFMAEATIWTSFVVLRTQGHLRENSYKEFAVQFAGISGTDHSDEFYKTIGAHDSSDDYERELKLEARYEIYPDVGYEALDRYYLDNRISDFEQWAWSSSDRRIDYRELRSSSRLAYRRSWYMVAAAAANRIVSAISVYQASRSLRADQGVQTSRYHLDLALPGKDDSFAAVSLIRTF